ncbi:CCA tRNA nucleotidyltransferase [Sanguibacter suaedae]|uniref:CCA tRNA nucleotidyltransferase n=1 Tax=Sanguibacter suaedae TaxID=2795737 RepID=A0A934MB49_9MICO|nr:HD domain-containing protein [Sanguibacter suaedae]MBI9114926.1 CCA tRNA nucleotidyltransferase [Sanguibacter suaedae]
MTTRDTSDDSPAPARTAARSGSVRRVGAAVPVTGAASRLLDAIRSAGGRGYLVGGCVRDALLEPGERPKDVDIEVHGLPLEALAPALARVARVDEVGRAFSVLTVTTGGESFDVSLPRGGQTPPSGDGRSRDDDLLAEASRHRDYTVNALMFDPRTGEVVDCWGGLDDLHAGVLRHTSSSFDDDPVRVLRGARLSARFGFTMAPSTVEASRHLNHRFPSLPTERVWNEWFLMAATARRPSAWLDVLEETGWIGHVPELAVLRGIPQDVRWHPEGDVLEHTRLASDVAARLADDAGLTGVDRAVVVLATMLHDVGKATHTQRRADGRITSHGHDEAGRAIAARFLARIGAPRSITARILPLVREHMVATSVREPTPAAVRRLARRLSPATMDEWALVVSGDRGGRGTASAPGDTGRWLELADAAGARDRPAPPLLSGRHLIAAGMPPGPAFSTVLDAALVAQDAGVFTTEEGALEWLARR